MHPLQYVPRAHDEPLEIPDVEPSVHAPHVEVLAPDEDAQAIAHAHTEPQVQAVEQARKLLPSVIARLWQIAQTARNPNAARAACRDLTQIGGILTETSRVDVIVSFRAIFQRMTASELDAFLKDKVLPERLKDEAMKLISQSGGS